MSLRTSSIFKSSCGAFFAEYCSHAISCGSLNCSRHLRIPPKYTLIVASDFCKFSRCYWYSFATFCITWSDFRSGCQLSIMVASWSYLRNESLARLRFFPFHSSSTYRKVRLTFDAAIGTGVDLPGANSAARATLVTFSFGFPSNKR